MVMPGPERGAWSSISARNGIHSVVRDRELEAFAHHADHRRVLVAKLHGAAEHIGIAAEARAPHLVADHGDRWRRGLRVGRPPGRGP